MSALVLILAGLAAARTYRVLAVDGIGAPVRWRFDAAVTKLNPPRVRYSMIGHLRRKDATRMEWRRYTLAKSLSEGFYCPYCIGFWIALAWLGTGLAWGDTWPWQLIAGALALNYAAAHLNARLDNEDPQDA